MPTFLTVAIAKFILNFNRWFGLGGGSALPGLVAENLDPKLLGKLAKRIPKGSIIITGTNGKTTTSKMAAEILRRSGLEPITNSGGSNLSRGILSTLIEKSTLFGMRGKIGLFEVDEAAMPAVAAAVKPSVIVVLNLFRDQLDRYGELDRTASMIGTAIASTTAKVYLNADDPLVASLAKYARKPEKVLYFGVNASKLKKLKSDHTADSIHCPVCGTKLKYDQEFFAHIGHYSCPKRDFKRPKPSVTEVGIKLQLPGLYNLYNAIGALAVGDALDLDRKQVLPILVNVAAAFGRVEKVTIDGKHLLLLLIKNPTGFNQIIQTFLAGDRLPGTGDSRKLLIAINDNFADGRDVSWLWDAGLEELTGKKIEVITSGTRAYDMALRLKYAEVKAEPLIELDDSVEKLLAKVKPGETAYVLPTYTAMLAIRKMISQRANLEGFWK